MKARCEHGRLWFKQCEACEGEFAEMTLERYPIWRNMSESESRQYVENGCLAVYNQCRREGENRGFR